MQNRPIGAIVRVERTASWHLGVMRGWQNYLKNTPVVSRRGIVCLETSDAHLKQAAERIGNFTVWRQRAYQPPLLSVNAFAGSAENVPPSSFHTQRSTATSGRLTRTTLKELTSPRRRVDVAVPAWITIAE